MSKTVIGAGTDCAAARLITFREAIREAIAEELERDERVFMMGLDVGIYGGAFGVAGDLQQRFGKRRVFSTPISETFMVGGGVGAAITGLRPIVELMYGDFAAVAMDEIYGKASMWRYMHGALFALPLVIRLPSGLRGGAGPEHSQCLEGLFWSAHGVYVVTPATPADAKGLLKTAIRDDNPVLFFEHKGLYNTKGEVPEGEHLVPLGEAVVRREGSDVTVIAWSNIVSRALEAADQLAGEGISVEVVDPRGIRPLDKATILQSVEKTGRVVLAHEAPRIGGPSGEVAAMIAEEALASLDAPIVRLGAPDVPIPQSIFLEQFISPTVADLVAAVQQIS
jgi:pyruvate/2-oxoglutarate/acetoin dehydrogenase E1 component